MRIYFHTFGGKLFVVSWVFCFFGRPGDILSTLCSVGVFILVHGCGNQNRCFKPNRNIFLNPTKCVLVPKPKQSVSTALRKEKNTKFHLNMDICGILLEILRIVCSQETPSDLISFTTKQSSQTTKQRLSVSKSHLCESVHDAHLTNWLNRTKTFSK